MMVISEANRAY